MVRNIFVSTVTFFLLVSLIACGSRAPQPAQAVLNTPVGGKLTVSSTSAFTDQFGIYHVVGAILNGTNNTLTSLELGVQIKDASGTSLLKDKSGAAVSQHVFEPMLSTLAPGETSPFDYSIDLAKVTPASFVVSVDGYQSGKAERAALTVENVQLVDDQKGTLYLSGRLVNSGSSWVNINALAGSVVGGGNSPLSAGSSFIHAGLLAPKGDAEQRDQAPFIISFPNPGPGQTDWRIYWDADTAQAPQDYPVAVNVTNSYFDQTGAYHLVGIAANNSASALNLLLVAGLYAQDGTVLDAAYSFYKIAVGPGKNMPFDISYFGSVNSIPAQASRVRTFTVQVDPSRTAPPPAQSMALTAVGEQVQRNGAAWTFSGSVTNTTNQNLSGVTVIVMVMDAQKDLVATNSSYILPTEGTIAPNGAVSYHVLVSLDPTIDSSDFRTTTTASGDVIK